MTIRRAMNGWRFALTLSALALGAFGCAGDTEPTIDPTVDEATSAMLL